MKFPQVVSKMMRAVVFTLALAAIFPAEAFAQKVLLLAADPAGAEDVQQRLRDTNRFTQVDLIRADLPGPTVSLATLLGYDSVMTWTNAPYNAPDELGDVLSQYVDAGHGVVEAAFTFFNDPSLNLGGRWRALSYDALTYGGADGFAGLTLVALQPGHPILSGVNGLNGDTYIGHVGTTVVSGQLIAEWSSHEPLVSARVGPQGGRVVGLNFYPVFATDADGARLMVNALLFATATAEEATTNHAPTADAGPDQTIEATGPLGAPFTVTGAIADPDAGDTLTIAWTGTGLVGNQASFSGTLLPPVGVNAVSYTLTLTVGDNQGGVVSDDVVITVTDTKGPVLANVPAATLTATATSDAGANVSYGPVTATDAVDGARPVVCSKSGLFPVGDTLVTCSSSDTRGNTSSASFTVRVTDVTTPGAMSGAGLVRAGNLNYEFEFMVRERGAERGRLQVRVTSSRGRRDDRFCARTTDFVAFSDDPTVRPGRGHRPQVDTVLFSGMGEWNGRSGYHYEVFAVDDVTRQHEAVRIVIKAPNGSVVASVDGKVTLGFVESERLRH